MEYAVVGVNAHVNFDLAPAVVRTCTVLGRSAPGPAERADYRAVNDVFSCTWSACSTASTRRPR